MLFPQSYFQRYPQIIIHPFFPFIEVMKTLFTEKLNFETIIRLCATFQSKFYYNHKLLDQSTYTNRTHLFRNVLFDLTFFTTISNLFHSANPNPNNVFSYYIYVDTHEIYRSLSLIRMVELKIY